MEEHFLRLVSSNNHTIIICPSLQLLNISMHFTSVRSSKQCFCQCSDINKFVDATINHEIINYDQKSE